MAYTKGPWSAKTPSYGFTVLHGPDGKLIFALAAGGPVDKRPDDECDDNLRAIIAAPAALAALRTTTRQLEAVARAYVSDPEAKAHTEAMIADNRAVLKAAGLEDV